MQTVFLKGGGQTRTRSWGDSSLYAIKTLPQKLIRVGPAELARFILNVFADAGIMLLDYDLTHERVLHHDTGEFSDVCRC